MSAPRLESQFDRFRSEGDTAALAAVFDATAPELLRLARHLAHDAAEAEDLVQGTFVAAIEKRASFDAARELRPWLTGILIKEASLVRRARSRAIDPARLDSRAVEDPAETLAAREIADTVASALAKLTPKDCEVLIPLLLDGRRAVEIARELGRRPDTVHMRIHRGLARLRRLLPPSFALGAFARSGEARGLHAVREEVLRCARRELGIAGGAVASTVLTGAGVGLMMKKIGIAAAIAVCLGVGGYFAVREPHELERSRLDGIAATIEPLDDVRRQKDEAASVAAELPASTSERSQASPTVSSMLEIEIVGEQRKPAGDTLVALVDAADTLHGSKTDAEGRCVFPASAGTGHLYVREDARLPHHVEIDLAAGRRTIELPRGGELAGRLELAGGTLLPPIVLRLSTDSAPEGFAEAQHAVYEALDLLEYDMKRLEARTTPGADGTFRFHGLAANWSGALLLPKEFVFIVDEKPTRSSEQVFPSSAMELLLPIAYRPRVIGRFVDAGTGRPVAGASTTVRFSWSDGNDMDQTIQMKPDGRFTIPLTYRTDPVGLAFDVSPIRVAGGAVAHSTVRRAWKGSVDPYDAGDVECTSPRARDFVFRVVDAAGSPIAGARARARDLQPVSANDQGIGRFPALPLETRELVVVAPGHALTSVALSAETGSPLDVALAPTNRLTIVLPAEVAGRKDLSLALASKESLFGGGSRMYDSSLRGATVGRCSGAVGNVGTEEGTVNFEFSSDGRVEVEGIGPGIPFRVRLIGFARSDTSAHTQVLDEVEFASIGPYERRHIDLAPGPASAPSLKVLRGRAIDEQGRPILGAGIATQFAMDMVVAHTEFDGGFELDLTGRESIDVEVTKRGHVPFRVRAWDVSPERLLEARLVRGRDLRVEIIDVQGHPIGGCRIEAEVTGFGPPWKIEDGSTGVFTLCDLPSGTAEITIHLAGKKYTRSQDVHSDVARIALPVHGRLEVAWQLHGARTQDKEFQLALRPLDSQGALQTEWTPYVDRIESHVFESVIPGEYTIGLEIGTESDDGSDVVYAPLHTPTRVTIAGGETRRVELAP